MKQLLIAAFAIMLTGNTLAVKASDGDKKNKQNTSKSEIESKEKPSRIGISIEIRFGRGVDCPDRGLCYIKAGANLAVIAIYNNDGNGTLTIQVPEEYIIENQPDKLQYFTGQTKFIVPEEYVLSQDICTKLGTQEHLVIKPGSYKLSFLDGIYTIIIGDML